MGKILKENCTNSRRAIVWKKDKTHLIGVGPLGGNCRDKIFLQLQFSLTGEVSSQST